MGEDKTRKVKMIAKLSTIIKSRLHKQREEDWVKQRRVTCLGCQYNYINKEHTTRMQDFLAALSYFLSWIFGRAEEDVLGNCTVCGCSCYFKSAEEEEACPKGKWKK